MKRLLGLLLVMGMVGCGGGDEAPPAGDEALPATPNKPAQTVDASPASEAALPATPKNEPHAKVDEPSVQAVGTNPSVASESVSPKTPADTVDDTPAQAGDVDPVAALKELGAQIEQDDQGRVVELNLSSTEITDEGLMHLKGLTNLRGLDLWRTQITDAGLLHLKGLTKLQNLDLRDTKVTDAGVAELQQSLPKCAIRKPNGKINK